MPLKIRIVVLLLAFFVINASAQDQCYRDLRVRGMQLLKEKNYRRAIDKFFAARYCPDKPTKDDLDDLIQKTQDRWVAALDNARKEAETQKQRAEASLERGNKLLTNLYYGNKAQGYDDINRDLDMYYFLLQSLQNVRDSGQSLQQRNYQAGVLSNLKLYDMAIAITDTILLEKSDYIPALQTRAVAYYYSDRMEDCIRDCDKIIAQNTYLYIAHLNKAQCLARLGKYDEATAVMKAGQYYFLQGDASEQYHDGDLSPEIEQVTGLQTLYIDEGGMRDKILYLLLSYRVYQGDAKALTEFEKLKPSQFINAYLGAVNFMWFHLKGRPQDYGAYIFEALLWENSGYPAQAMESIAHFFTNHKQLNDARYTDMVAFAKAKQAQLKATSTKNFQLPPQVEAVGLSIKAKQLQTNSNYKEALALMIRAATLDPDNLSYRITKMNLYNNLGDCNKIQEEAIHILKKWKNCTQALYFKARCDYNKTEDVNKLEKALAAVLEIDAYHTDTLEFLGYWYAEADTAFAIQMLERYLQIIPGNQDVRTKLETLRSKN